MNKLDELIEDIKARRGKSKKKTKRKSSGEDDQLEKSENEDDTVLRYNYAVILHFLGKTRKAIAILGENIFEVNEEIEIQNDYINWKS